MNNKGFTLVELLAVILIIGFLASIGVISSNVFFNKAETNYYTVIENSMLLAGNDYYENHRNELPSGDEYSEVSLASLIEGKYIEPVKDSSGNVCTNGVVFVYRENGKYVYEACIIGCGEYTSNGKYCGGAASKKINVTSQKVGGGEYDVLKSYNSQSYSDGKDIEVTFSMASEYSVIKYVVVNTKNSAVKEECNATNNSCGVTIKQTGTYKVTAYGTENKEISTRYINVKIAKGQANFTLEGENKYIISKEDCNNNKKTAKVTINIVKEAGVEYETIKYQINDGEYNEPKGLKIEENLESGHYDLNVVVSKYSGEDATKHFAFDVSYLVDYEFEDDHTTGTHEVIKGKTYNYLSSLPATKEAYGQNINVRWHKNDVLFDPNTEVVTDNCTHQLVGKTIVRVNVPSDLTVYCNTLTYNGSNQTLTKEAPANITFTNNVGKNAGSYTVKAQLSNPQYIWSDGTSEDKEFSCSIEKAVATLTCADRTYNGSAQNMYSESTGCSSVTNGSQTSAGGPWTLTCVPDSNHTAPSTCKAKMNPQACAAPTNVSISTAGKVTWTASSNCSSAKHQISIDNSTFTNATSGVNYKSTIIESTGSRTVYVRAVAPNTNYSNSTSASKSTTVYSVSLTKGSCDTATGGGNFITGAKTTIAATRSGQYYWINWTGSATYTDASKSITVDGNKSFTANCGDGCASGNTKSTTTYGSCVATTCKKSKTVTVTSTKLTYTCSTTTTSVACAKTDKCWRYKADYGNSDDCGSSYCPPLCGFPIDTSQPGNGTESHLNEWRCQSKKTTFNTAANMNVDWNAFFGRYCWCKTTG